MLTTQEIKKAVKVINEANGKLSYKLDNISWSKLYTNYLKENVQEEKAHDNYRPGSVSRPLSITEAGKLFAVRSHHDSAFVQHFPVCVGLAKRLVLPGNATAH